MSSESAGGVKEIKFPLGAELISPVLEWMRTTIPPDPHGEGEHGDAYLVQSVYLDTPEFDVFHRRGSYARAKFRIRRYNQMDRIFLERKMKRSGTVRKRRVLVPPEDLAHLGAELNGARWPGRWFHDRLALRRLAPVIQMSYRRIARLGQVGNDYLRVTMDRELRATPTARFLVPHPVLGEDLLRGGAVLEVKYDHHVPGPVKELMERFRLEPSGLSKYRLGVQSCGLAAPEPPTSNGTAVVSEDE